MLAVLKGLARGQRITFQDERYWLNGTTGRTPVPTEVVQEAKDRGFLRADAMAYVITLLGQQEVHRAYHR
jgi:hypothetical protein